MNGRPFFNQPDCPRSHGPLYHISIEVGRGTFVQNVHKMPTDSSLKPQLDPPKEVRYADFNGVGTFR
jgi:hypothetical protein